MHLIDNYFLLTALSFFIGTVVGLTGIGGASLITPMLIFVFQVPASVAISSDIVAATMMKVVGAYQHWQQETLDWQTVKWLALGSVPGSLAGVAALWLIRQNSTVDLDGILLRCIAVALLLVSVTVLGQLFFSQVLRATGKDSPLTLPTIPSINLETTQGRVLCMAIGAVLGTIVGVTSISSGAMFALLLITCFRLNSRQLVGTDIAQAAILLSFTSLGHLMLGTVSWAIVIPIWIGSIPGVMLGAKLCQFVPQQALKFVICTLLVMTSLRLVEG